MNSIGKLIKAKTISFKDVLIQNYISLNLNEVESMILMILYNQQEEGNTFLSIKELKKHVTISLEDLSSYVMLLVQKGTIELLIDEEGKEKFNLDPLINQLGELLEKNEEQKSDYQIASNISEITSYIERLYGRLLSPSDLIIVNNWVKEGYDIDDIKKALMESTKAQKMHLKYADAILINQNKKRRVSNQDSDDEIKRLLASVYVKK